MDYLKLKTYLLSNFTTENPQTSLVDIFVMAHDKFMELKGQGTIATEAFPFFNAYEAELMQLSAISTENLRKKCYENLIDEYVAGMISREAVNFSNQKNQRNTETLPKKEDVQNLHCPEDLCILKKFDEKKVISKASKKRLMKFYQCNVCGKKFVSAKGVSDHTIVRYHNENYVNIEYKADKDRLLAFSSKIHELGNKKCYVTAQEKIRTCEACKGEKFQSIIVHGTNKTNFTERIYTVKYCLTCGAININYNFYQRNHDFWQIENPELVDDIQKNLHNDFREIKNSTAQNPSVLQTAKTDNIRNISTGEKEPEKISVHRKHSLPSEHGYRNSIDLSMPIRFSHDRQMKNLANQEQETMHTVPKETESIQIDIRDFLIRRDVFRCVKHEHKLESVEAAVQIMDLSGDIMTVKAMAGYCPDCDVYYILDSTFKDLKKRGRILCRVSDENTYRKYGTTINGMNLAAESILKQYGYSVGEQEDLSELARQRILTMLVDHRVMTKEEIISYLDFFIRSRKNQDKFDNAVMKWKKDRLFIETYKRGTFRTVQAASISRKKKKKS